MSYYPRLRDLREDIDKNQDEIARFLQITRQQYQLYESGKREIKVFQLIKLAEYYHVSIDYIVGRTNNKNINK